MQLKDYIKVIPDALDTKFCSEIVKNKKYKYKTAEMVGDNSVLYRDTKIRNCFSSTVLGEDDSIIYQAIGVVIKKYINEIECDLPSIIDDSGYQILKYEKGGFYVQHTDEVKGNTRRVSISLCLNEDYEGGEFQFFSDYKVVGKTGDAVVFPSNFCFPHEILPVKSNTRYSIITWVY
jgi:predicted 2-oxoglutarate/Fe(II)-dependent dioxygenase YbiX